MHINSLAGYITSFLVVVKISTEYMTEYTMIYTHISMYIHVFLLVVAISLHRTLALARPSRPLNCGTPPSSHRDSRWGIRDGDPGWSELDGNNRRGVAGIPVFCSTFYGFIKSTFMSFFLGEQSLPVSVSAVSVRVHCCSHSLGQHIQWWS